MGISSVFAKVTELGLRQSVLKILIAEASYQPVLTGFFFKNYIRQPHSVKGIVLNHSINSHVAKAEPVARLKLPVEGVVPDYIACKTGGACYPAGIFFFHQADLN